jgi:DNA-binding IclR family transcriptional regulator
VDDAIQRAIDNFEAWLNAMPEAQRTLFLARHGRSPEDVRRALERVATQEWIVDQGRAPPSVRGVDDV